MVLAARVELAGPNIWNALAMVEDPATAEAATGAVLLVGLAVGTWSDSSSETVAALTRRLLLLRGSC